jgi:hypothetical protein
MNRSNYVKLFLASWILTTAAVYWPLADAGGSLIGQKAASDVLHKEARLIEYFCLSKIPPAFGAATVPRAWGEALNSDIGLRETVGEVADLAPALKDRTEEVKNLGAGQSIYARDASKNYLVYRPQESNLYIIVSKVNSDMAPASVATPSPLATALASGLIVALLLTGLTRYILRSSKNAVS